MIQLQNIEEKSSHSKKHLCHIPNRNCGSKLLLVWVGRVCKHAILTIFIQRIRTKTGLERAAEIEPTSLGAKNSSRTIYKETQTIFFSAPARRVPSCDMTFALVCSPTRRTINHKLKYHYYQKSALRQADLFKFLFHSSFFPE